MISYNFSFCVSILSRTQFNCLGIIQFVCLQLGPKFMKENGIKHVTFSTADGALEAAPAVRFYSICISALDLV